MGLILKHKIDRNLIDSTGTNWATNPPRQLDISLHNCYTFGMNGTQIPIIKEY